MTRLLRIAKRSYFLGKFFECRGDARTTWNLIRKVLSNNNSKKSVKQLIVEGTVLNVETDISEAFNDYFINVTGSLDGRIPHSDVSPLYSMRGDFPHSLFLYPVTSNEIKNIIIDLKNGTCNKSKIPAFLFRKACVALSVPIARLINMSFGTGIFPDILKEAHIVPVHKSGSEYEVCNYRPISVLSYISKIFEKCLTIRIVHYANRCELLCLEQFGFRKGRNTTDALVSVTEYVYKSLNAKEHAVGVFIDLRKAFDTVNHDILLSKLEYYGFRGTPLKLLESYLRSRRQAVRIGSTISQYKTVEMGIPQGSNLGPLLFLFYINDLPNISNIFKFTLFADDTTLLASDSCYNQLIARVNEGMKDIVEWTRINRLTINVDKTVALLFTNRLSAVDLNLSVVIEGKSVSYDSKVKYLGVMLDDKLRFDTQINHICDKLSRSIGVLYKLRPYMPDSVLVSCYYSLIYPYLIYCNVVWGGASDVYLDRLFLLQKRAIRIITGSAYRDHTNSLFRRTQILKLEELRIYQLCIYVYKKSVLGEVERTRHGYDTRNRNNVLLAFQRLSLSQNSVSFAAPAAWNALPSYLREVSNISKFKCELKSFLLSRYV